AEVAELLEQKGHGNLKPWDLNFGVQLLKKERCGGFDVKGTQQYFPVHKVIPALQKNEDRRRPLFPSIRGDF
nr:hypothetical protein [Tanacetum cinerariifolium]